MTSYRWLVKALAHDSDECLLWPFGCFDSGYPLVTKDHTPLRAHRELCRLAHGEPPTPRHEAAHSCGTRGCMNRRHLRWATRKENEADKLKQGRPHGPRREMHGCHKLTEAEVLAIRACGGSQSKTAAQYGVSQTTVWEIRNRKTWRTL